MALLYFASSVVLPVLLAAVASMALKPIIRVLTGWHVPKIIAAVLVLGFFLAAAGYGCARLKEPVLQWAKKAPEYKARVEQDFNNILHRGHATPTPNVPPPNSTAQNSPKSGESTAAARQAPVKLQDYQSILAWTGATLGETVEAIVLVFLLLISGEWFGDALAGFASSSHSRTLVRETIDQIQNHITQYLFTVSIINLCVGILVGAGLAILKFPNAAMWGAMAFLLNFIPYFGPIFGIIVLGVVGLFSVGSFPKEFYPMAWYTVVHISEADCVTPMFLGRRFTIHPVIIFVFLMFASWIWGVCGALLAVPILVSIKVICDRVPSLAPFGLFLAHEARPK